MDGLAEDTVHIKARYLVLGTLLAVLAATAVLLGSCDLAKNVPGNIAGIVMDEHGRGQGYISVRLIEAESGRVIEQQTSSDSGHFHFQKIAAGTYKLELTRMGGTALPHDMDEAVLLPGKTLRLDVTLVPAE